MIPVLAGYRHKNGGSYVKGLFDQESFIECMKDWASNVVVGRGRIGGYPIGLVSSQMASFTVEEPMDPARLKDSYQRQAVIYIYVCVCVLVF